MKKSLSLPLILSLVAQLACDGTDVGNAVTAEIQMASTQDDEMALTLDSGVEIDEAFLSVARVSVRPQSDCDREKSDVTSWHRKAQSFWIDLLDASPLSIKLAIRDKEICQIRFVLSPRSSGEHAGKSLYFSGTTADARAFVIESTRKHVLVLKAKSSQGFVLSDQKGKLLEAVLHLEALFDSFDLSEISGDPLVISPTEHSTAFRIFTKFLRRHFRAYRFLKNGSVITRPRNSELGEGDETGDELISGEY